MDIDAIWTYRSVHHFALLLGYGAGSINPYLAFETLDDMINTGMIRPEVDHVEAVKRYRKRHSDDFFVLVAARG